MLDTKQRILTRIWHLALLESSYLASPPTANTIYRAVPLPTFFT